MVLYLSKMVLIINVYILKTNTKLNIYSKMYITFLFIYSDILFKYNLKIELEINSLQYR